MTTSSAASSSFLRTAIGTSTATRLMPGRAWLAAIAPTIATMSAARSASGHDRARSPTMVGELDLVLGVAGSSPRSHRHDPTIATGRARSRSLSVTARRRLHPADLDELVDRVATEVARRIQSGGSVAPCADAANLNATAESGASSTPMSKAAELAH